MAQISTMTTTSTSVLQAYAQPSAGRKLNLAYFQASLDFYHQITASSAEGSSADNLAESTALTNSAEAACADISNRLLTKEDEKQAKAALKSWQPDLSLTAGTSFSQLLQQSELQAKLPPALKAQWRLDGVHTQANFLLLDDSWNQAANSLIHDPDNPWCLIYYAGRLAIAQQTTKGKGRLVLDPSFNPVYVDFCQGTTNYRLQNVFSEAVVKACFHKGVEHQWILDCTGGFGQDGMMLREAGANMFLLERNFIIGLLLSDGLYRLLQSEQQAQPQSDYPLIRFCYPHSVIEESTRARLADYSFSSIYLDPMYPHTPKSAKVNKQMQLIQAIVGHDQDADALLPSAQSLSFKRIVVKRPKGAPFLDNQPTKTNLETPGHRFDYYVWRI